MATLTRQDLNFGQGKSQFICKFTARYSFQMTTLWVFWLYWSLTVVADILCEFLEVAIHLILYVREVYPSGIFQKRKKYNVPVQVMFSRLMIALWCICKSMLFGNIIAWFSTREHCFGYSACSWKREMEKMVLMSLYLRAQR